jgi:flagellar biogenesis protein FliO
LCFTTKAQQNNDVSLIIGEKNITLEDPFIVTVIVKFVGDAQTPDCTFPDLPNFTKRAITKQTGRSMLSGQLIVTCTITQNYAAKKEGNLKVSNFKVTVNGSDLKSESFVVKVGKTVSPEKKLPNNEETPLFKDNPDKKEDFTDFIEGNNTNPEFINLNTKEDAFLSLSSSKSNPYVGEGFTITFALYVAENNAAELGFETNNGAQIAAIIKKIKPENCWEESFGLVEIQQNPVGIKGKKYMQYKIYEATFYALNNRPIIFPTVDFRLQKFVTEKNGQKKSSFVTFSTRPFRIVARELPAHPLKNEVSVGQFSWKESLDKYKVSTGKSVSYRLQVSGDGYNIKLPQIKNDSIFDFFPPKIVGNVNPQSDKIITTKSLTFQIIPKRAGNFALEKYFQWIYFNTNTEKYDTLKSKVILGVSGQTIQTADTPTEGRTVYDGLENEDSSIEQNNFTKILKDEANILIVIMLAGMIYIFLPNRKR